MTIFGLSSELMHLTDVVDNACSQPLLAAREPSSSEELQCISSYMGRSMTGYCEALAHDNRF